MGGHIGAGVGPHPVRACLVQADRERGQPRRRTTARPASANTVIASPRAAAATGLLRDHQPRPPHQAQTATTRTTTASHPGPPRCEPNSAARLGRHRFCCAESAAATPAPRPCRRRHRPEQLLADPQTTGLHDPQQPGAQRGQRDEHAPVGSAGRFGRTSQALPPRGLQPGPASVAPAASTATTRRTRSRQDWSISVRRIRSG